MFNQICNLVVRIITSDDGSEVVDIITSDDGSNVITVIVETVTDFIRDLFG